MLSLQELLTIPPYSLTQKDKNHLMLKHLLELSNHHYQHCSAYKNILTASKFNANAITEIEQIPFLPVRLFKNIDLISIDKDKIVKLIVSSGTTGQTVSRIYLDAETALNQRKVLVKIVSSFIGSSRLPMLIIDSESIMTNKGDFSARNAGVLGFSIFASDKQFMFDDNMTILRDEVRAFLKKHQDKPILVFGFTSIVWQYLHKKIMQEPLGFNIPNGILIHGGGWKKLKDEAVSSKQFKQSIHDGLGISSVYDYYGMVEQTGCVYMECSEGHFHASIFSDVIIRNSRDFSVCAVNERGLIQVVSMLPRSYPGHSILTEDEGVVLGEDDCPCGRLGKYFHVIGRLASAEIRGCSDTDARG